MEFENILKFCNLSVRELESVTYLLFWFHTADGPTYFPNRVTLRLNLACLTQPGSFMIYLQIRWKRTEVVGVPPPITVIHCLNRHEKLWYILDASPKQKFPTLLLFACILCVHIYAKLQNFIQLCLITTNLCCIKWEHLVNFYISLEILTF